MVLGHQLLNDDSTKVSITRHTASCLQLAMYRQTLFSAHQNIYQVCPVFVHLAEKQQHEN